MKLLKIAKGILYSSTVIYLMTACSDGIDGTGAAPASPAIMLSGIAAVGAPIANANITVKGKTGKKTTGKTALDGSFQINVSGLVAPYLLKLQRDSAADLYSIAVTPGKVNIHPFTNLIVRNWFQVRGYLIETEFQGSQAASITPSKIEINTIEKTIKKTIRLVLLEFNLSQSFSLMSEFFQANSQGFDALLDRITIQLAYNRITISIVNLDTNFIIKTLLINDISLNTDFTIADVITPSIPTGLVSIASDSNNAIVAWISSKDNFGVAGYNVYRDDIKIATTAYTLYRDTNLSPDTIYRYTIEAFDGAGNLSNKVIEKNIVTPQTPDLTPPVLVSGLSIVEQSSAAVKISWPASSGALGYDIYTGTTSNPSKLIATSIATNYLDMNPISFPTETCYVVRAFDAARNTSGVSNEVCATLK
ncbi:MAG: fibronectin type III domain-containing protein [Thiohalomonadales bacterium]